MTSNTKLGTPDFEYQTGTWNLELGGWDPSELDRVGDDLLSA